MENRLGKTALYICAGRAMETMDRSESEWLYEDKYAKELSGEYGFEFMKVIADLLPKEIDQKTRMRMLADSVSVRTKYIDLQIQKYQSEIKQYVIFGVGGDSRSYRLMQKEATVYEIDLPEVMEYRESMFKKMNAEPNCTLKSIKCDLSKKEVWIKMLNEAGFDKTKKTLFLIEGLLMYLQEADVETFLDEISKLAIKDSVLVGDILTKAHLISEGTKSLRELWKEWGSEIVSAFTYPEKLIDKYGWKTTVDAYGTENACFGRIDKDSLDYYNKFPRGCPEEESMPRNLFLWSIKTKDY